MRTLWNITASLVLLIPACTSGEYSTTPPDMALPVIDMPSKPILQNMIGAQCGSKINISSGPYQSCSCTINCADLGVSCNLVAGSDMGESCDGKDNDCDGQIDEGAAINSSADYSNMPLISGSWDRNCNGKIEFGVLRTGVMEDSRILMLVYKNSCTQADLDAACNNIGTSNCVSYAVTCVMPNESVSCKESRNIYPCKGVTVPTPSCKSEPLSSPESLDVLCK